MCSNWKQLARCCTRACRILRLDRGAFEHPFQITTELQWLHNCEFRFSKSHCDLRFTILKVTCGINGMISLAEETSIDYRAQENLEGAALRGHPLDWIVCWSGITTLGVIITSLKQSPSLNPHSRNKSYHFLIFLIIVDERLVWGCW